VPEDPEVPLVPEDPEDPVVPEDPEVLARTQEVPLKEYSWLSAVLKMMEPVGTPAVLRLVVAFVVGMLTPSLSVLMPTPEVLDIL
jgi:hypothetical protein